MMSGGVGASLGRVTEGSPHRGSRAFTLTVERIAPAVRYVFVEGPVTRAVPEDG
jgi:hypothetical protein